jgi:hypothetical protein
MCIQRLIAAARPGLPSAIFIIRSKYACGKMCGKMSSLRSTLGMRTPQFGVRILVQRLEEGGDVFRIANAHSRSGIAVPGAAMESPIAAR